MNKDDILEAADSILKLKRKLEEAERIVNNIEEIERELKLAGDCVGSSIKALHEAKTALNSTMEQLAQACNDMKQKIDEIYMTIAKIGARTEQHMSLIQKRIQYGIISGIMLGLVVLILLLAK